MAGQFIRGAPSQLFPRSVVDVVNTFTHIPLGDMCEHGTFGDDHAEHGMHIFNPGLLVAAHGITIKNAGSCQFLRAVLQGIRLAEFNTPVRQDGREEEGKLICAAKSVLKRIKDRFHSTGCTPWQEMRPEQLGLRKVKGKDALARASGRFYCIHLDVIQFIRMCLLKVGIGPPCKHRAVRDLGFVTFSGLELYLTFQVNVPGKEKPLIDIVVEGVHGDPQLRMVCDDHVRRLSLADEGLHDPVDSMKFLLRQVNAGTGIGKAVGILPVRRFRIVIVFRGNLAFVAGDRAAVADKGGFGNMAAFLTFEPVTDVVADVTGAAMDVAQGQFFAGIGFFAAEPVDTEVIGISKATPVPSVYGAVLPDFIRDGGGILAEISGYFTEGFSFIQGLFDK